MARPLWTGVISFGLVTIPVRLFPAVRHKEVQFHLVHKTDGARIYEQRFCQRDDKQLEVEDLARGFELSARRMVVVSQRELEAADPKTNRRIGIEDFVELSEIDPIFFERTYFLVPDATSRDAYALLLRAMEQTGRVGIGRIVMRQRQYLAAVRPVHGLLGLSTLVYADELVPAARAGGPSLARARVKPRELAVATQLIKGLSKAWRPARYKDQHRARVLALVKRKAKGKAVEVPPAAKPKATRVADLLEQLQASRSTKRSRK